MVTCSICKENREVKNDWLILEHGSDNNIIHNFKVCDDCAFSLIRRIDAAMKTSSKKEGAEPELSAEIDLFKTGFVNRVLLKDKRLEIILSMDLAKARKIVLEDTLTE